MGESSSWLGVDVVPFTDEKCSQLPNEGGEKRASKLFNTILRNIFRRSRSLSKSTCATSTSIVDGNDSTGSSNTKAMSVSLPPRSMDESDWIRGIPSSDEFLPNITDIKSWHFDPLSYTSSALVPVFSIMLHHYDIPTKFHVSIETIDAFAVKVKGLYNPNTTYHNFHHAITTLHMSFMLLIEGGADAYLDDLDIFSLLLAAFVHDIDHTGKTNAFEISSKNSLSAKYANRSVLENHSVDVTFNDVLPAHGCDILKGLGEDDKTRVLSIVKGLILETDVARHGEMLKKLAKLKEDAETADTEIWNKEDADSRFLLSSMILHAADISNPVMPDFDVTKDWSLRISKEFRQQADKERQLGLDVTAFMDGLTDEYTVAKQQEGFYNFMALPLFAILSEVLPSASVLEKWGRQNLEKYIAIVKTTDEWMESNQKGEL